MKKIIIFLFLFYIFCFIVHSNIVANDRKSSFLPWLGTKFGFFDIYHNVGNSYEAENSRFEFLLGTLKGKNVLVKDSITGFIWETTPSKEKRNWIDSVNYCNGLVKGGYDDWRLPTIKELSSIVDYSIDDGRINSDFFTIIKGEYYWSSTIVARKNNTVFTSSFEKSHVRFGKEDALYSICVRSDD